MEQHVPAMEGNEATGKGGAVIWSRDWHKAASAEVEEISGREIDGEEDFDF